MFGFRLHLIHDVKWIGRKLKQSPPKTQSLKACSGGYSPAGTSGSSQAVSPQSVASFLLAIPLEMLCLLLPSSMSSATQSIAQQDIVAVSRPSEPEEMLHENPVFRSETEDAPLFTHERSLRQRKSKGKS